MPTFLRSIRILVLSLLLIAALGLSRVPARADALDHWASNRLDSATACLECVTYANGRYVAAGGGPSYLGVIYTSEDGLNWTLRMNSGTNIEISSLAYGGGTFVAVGYDAGLWGSDDRYIYSSTNGIDWVPRGGPSVWNLFGITYGGGEFVAVGDGDLVVGSGISLNIYTSTDGISWTARDSGLAGTIYDVAYGGGQFVAIGNGGYVLRSTMGVAWTKVHLLDNAETISYANGLFFIPIGPGSNLVSPDGTPGSWWVLTNNTGLTFGKIIYSNGLYVAAGYVSAQDASFIFTSTNGTSWVQHDSQLAGRIQLAFGDRRVVAGGGYHNYLFLSDPFAAVAVSPGFPPALQVSGLLDRTYRIEALDGALGTDSKGWTTLATFPLASSPYSWTDNQATNTLRLYRAVLLP